MQLQGPSRQQMLFTEQGGEAGRCFCFSELGFQEGANRSLQTYYSSQRGWTCGEEESPQVIVRYQGPDFQLKETRYRMHQGSTWPNSPAFST